MTHVQESNAARPLFQIASMSFLSRIFVITLLALGAAPVWAACQEQQASPSVDDCKKKEEQAREAMAKEREEERRKVREICDAHKDVPIPPENLPTQQDRQELSKCASGQSLESGIFYAGVTAPPDYVKARKCAYLERESGMGWPQIGGAARLLQIYAQGRGVPKNMKLTVRFACEWGEDPELVESLISTDVGVQRQLKEEDYSVCTAARSSGSGGVSGNCTGESVWHEQLKTEGSITELKAMWPKEALAAYTNLYEAADRFFYKDAEFIVFQWCYLCTGGHAARAAETERMWTDFYETIREGGGVRSPNFSVYKKFDGELNAAYRQLVKKLDSKRSEYEEYPDDMMGLAISSIKDAQLAWIRYRDAFEKFGQLLTPPVSYKGYLTAGRANQLRHYVETYEVQ